MFSGKSLVSLVFLTLMSFRAGADVAVGTPAPEITSSAWLNSEPLAPAALRGKVVLVEFWTYGCWNCRNVEPYVKKWHERYGARGLAIVGVHTPEFSHERDAGNVRRYVEKNAIRHAVALDNDSTVWDRYQNRYWPAFYLVDKNGIIRYHHVGEGAYDETERQIRVLLAAP